MKTGNATLSGVLLVVSSFAVPCVYANALAAGTSPKSDEVEVGSLATYDYGTGVVLMKPTGVSGPVTNYDGYFQSSIIAPLETNSELTVVAEFKEDVSFINNTTSSYSVKPGGTFNVYLDANKNHSFKNDNGFTDGDLVLTGTVVGGTGAAGSSPEGLVGVTDIDIAVTSFNAEVFGPALIFAADNIFTLRMGSKFDENFLDGISSVQGHSINPQDLKFAANGYLVVAAVPEADTYAMFLAGIGLMGLIVQRRKRGGSNWAVIDQKRGSK